ncbi:MAG: hypothetical protein SGARI_000557 [Bacillariaceae sp.]
MTSETLNAVPEDEVAAASTLPKEAPQPRRGRRSGSPLPQRQRRQRKKAFSEGVAQMTDDDLLKSKQARFASEGNLASVRFTSLPDYAGRLSTRDLNLETHGLDSRRAAALRFLHQKWLQWTLCGLLVLDVLILFTELMLLAAYPACHIIERDCIACCSEGDHQGEERWLAGDGHHEEICEAGYLETGEPSCDGHKWHAVHTAEEVMFWFTITILAIFFVELNVELWALGPGIFFRQAFFAVDYLVITISIVLEMTFHFHAKQFAEELAGFIVIFRLWRFVRIGHGIVEVTAELGHQQYEDLIEFAGECEDLLLENDLTVPETTEKVKEMIEEAEEEHQSQHPA